MMFKLESAGIGIRKAAAYYYGVRQGGTWQPVHGGYDALADPNGDLEVIALIYDHRGKEYPLRAYQVDVASCYTWREIRRGTP